MPTVLRRLRASRRRWAGDSPTAAFVAGLGFLILGLGLLAMGVHLGFHMIGPSLAILMVAGYRAWRARNRNLTHGAKPEPTDIDL